MGAGRLVEPVDIVEHVKALLGRERGDLIGWHIVVSAGGPHAWVGAHPAITSALVGLIVA